MLSLLDILGDKLMEQPIFNNGMNAKQLQLSNTIRQLWIEHVVWTRFFIISSVFDLPDLPMVTQRLLKNPDDFARILKPFYGEQKAMEFKHLLTDHLLIAADLLNAAKSGNTAEADKQRMLWYSNAEEISRFLASINPLWQSSKWENLLFSHLQMLEDEISFILTGQCQNGINLFEEIQAEALTMANYMTYGLIRQFRIV